MTTITIDRVVCSHALKALQHVVQQAQENVVPTILAHDIMNNFHDALQPVQKKNTALAIPKEWYTERAVICFAKSYNGEGSYYCPHCDINAGSVWVDHAWRPTKYQALCYNCRELFKEVT